MEFSQKGKFIILNLTSQPTVGSCKDDINRSCRLVAAVPSEEEQKKEDRTKAAAAAVSLSPLLPASKSVRFSYYDKKMSCVSSSNASHSLILSQSESSATYHLLFLVLSIARL